MTNVSKTSPELIAEAQEHYSEMNGLNSRAAEVMMELVAALESATRVPEQGEAQVEAAVKVLAPDGVFAKDFGEYSRKRDNYRREDQAEEQRYYMRKARAALEAATRVPVQGKPPALTFDEAREMACVLSARGEFADGITVESIWARGAVWGALGGDRRNYVAVQGEPNDDRGTLMEAMKRGEKVRQAAWSAYGQEPDGEGTKPYSDNWYRAEALMAAGFSRATVPDAALAAIAAARVVCLQLGGVDGDVSQPAPSYYVSVGRNVVATEVLAALDGAPEPEWEYRYAEIHDDSEMYTYGPRDNADCCFDTAEDARDERIEDTDVVVRRPKRPASEWEVCE